jgi:hypothetical protein
VNSLIAVAVDDHSHRLDRIEKRLDLTHTAGSDSVVVYHRADTRRNRLDRGLERRRFFGQRGDDHLPGAAHWLIPRPVPGFWG